MSVNRRFKWVEQVTSQRWWWKPENAIRGEEHEKKSGPGNPINSGRKIIYIMIIYYIAYSSNIFRRSWIIWVNKKSGWKTSKLMISKSANQQTDDYQICESPLKEIRQPGAQFLDPDWGMKPAMASGCRTVLPAYVACWASTTTRSHSCLHPPARE